jgi:hypothetical protein
MTNTVDPKASDLVRTTGTFTFKPTSRKTKGSRPASSKDTAFFNVKPGAISAGRTYGGKFGPASPVRHLTPAEYLAAIAKERKAN